MKLAWHIKHKIYLERFRNILDKSFSEAVSLDIMLLELRLKRVGAVARDKAGNFDEFYKALDLSLTPKTKKKLETAFNKYCDLLTQTNEFTENWDKIFFGGKTDAFSDADLKKIDKRRVGMTEKILRPFDLFSFLCRQKPIPYLRLETDSQDQFFLNWSKELADPERLYDILVKKPAVEESKRIVFPKHSAYFIKFRSSSHSMYDFVHGKVFEPNSAICYKTVIISDGWSMSNDQEQMSFRIEKLCENLARKNVRAIVLESPWQGRRTPNGFYSGEKFLSNVPATIIQMLSSHTLEITSVIDWARSAKNSRKVVMVGLSMSGYIATCIVSRCRQWTLNYWPDDIVFTEITSLIERTLIGTLFTKKIGLAESLQNARWDKESIRQTKQLIELAPRPGMPPEKIHAFVSGKDHLGFRDFTLKTAYKWKLPKENIIRVNSNHLDLTTKILRDKVLEELLDKILE